MVKLTVEPMTENHISALSEIERDCFSKPWSENALKAELSNETSFFFVAEKNETVCGYIGSHIVLDECYIANVAVLPDFRKSGVASALIEALLEKATEKDCLFVSLEVRKSNSAAISLYNKFGFSLCGERKNFYSEPTENAYIMTKKLKD